MIRSLIIDDEADAREALKLAIEKYCPGIDIVAVCGTPEKGLEAIKSLQPDLVFLDVQMPRMSGFDLLEQLETINFAVIFATAYDRYAIKAIRFSALDYLLKPIDPDELVGAIQKVEKSQHHNGTDYRYKSVFTNVKNRPANVDKLAIPDTDGIIFVDTLDIIYCEADGNYTKLFLTGRRTTLVSKPLKDFEAMLADSGFSRVHHAALINMKHIKKYVKGDGGYVILTDDHHVDVSRRKKEAFLMQLHKV